jgi:hypothetical protein
MAKYLVALTSDPCPLLSAESRALLTPADGVAGLAWWGRDATYGRKSGGVWSHGGYMEGVRTHMYLFPPAANTGPEVDLERQQHWRGAVILTNGEVDYSSIELALKELLFQ